MRILYVEDHIMLAETNKYILLSSYAEGAIDLVHVATLAEATEALSAVPFDLVVSDYIFPQFLGDRSWNPVCASGLMFYDCFLKSDSASPLGEKPAFAFLSAEGRYEVQEALAQKGLDLPLDRIFEKPTPLKEVVETLTQTLPLPRRPAPRTRKNKNAPDR